MTNRSDGTPAVLLGIQNPLLLDLGLTRTHRARATPDRSSEPVRPPDEPIFDRTLTVLTLGAAALAMLLLWAPIVLELAAAARGLLGGVLVGVLFAAFAVFYGLLRFVTAPRIATSRWKLRILAVLGSVAHAAIYVQALQ